MTNIQGVAALAPGIVHHFGALTTHDRASPERGRHMSFFNSTALDDLARRLADSVPESVRSLGRDLEGNFKAVLQAQLAKLDLVTRQDFDVQSAILERTRAKLSDLEARLTELEDKAAR
jgi:hypothetical protein